LQGHPTQDIVAAGYGDGTILMLRPTGGAEILVRRNGGAAASALAWNPKGTLLAFAAEDNGILADLIRCAKKLQTAVAKLDPRPASEAQAVRQKAGQSSPVRREHCVSSAVDLAAKTR
jgi:hypothetical protein